MPDTLAVIRFVASALVVAVILSFVLWIVRDRRKPEPPRVLEDEDGFQEAAGEVMRQIDRYEAEQARVSERPRVSDQPKV